MSNSAPPEWWKDEKSLKPGPARIRVTLNRTLTAAEHEHLAVTFKQITESIGDKVRIAPDDRIYAESNEAPSRGLYTAVAATVERAFVNVFPVAVRTFRELVVVKHNTGGVVKPAPVDDNVPVFLSQGHALPLYSDSRRVELRTPSDFPRSNIVEGIRHIFERFTS